jgi:hypothetical protein
MPRKPHHRDLVTPCQEAPHTGNHMVIDAEEARTSVLVATGFISVFYTLLFVLGFDAIALVLGDPQFKDTAGNRIGGTNMVAFHLPMRSAAPCCSVSSRRWPSRPSWPSSRG